MKAKVALLAVAVVSLALVAHAAARPPGRQLTGWARDARDAAREAGALARRIDERADESADDILLIDDLQMFAHYADLLQAVLLEGAGGRRHGRRLLDLNEHWPVIQGLNHRMRRSMLDVDAGIAPLGREWRREWFDRIRPDAEELSRDILSVERGWRGHVGRRDDHPREGFVSVRAATAYNVPDADAPANALVVEAEGGDVRVRAVTFTTLVRWRGILGMRQTHRLTPNYLVGDGDTVSIRLLDDAARIENLRVEWTAEAGRDPWARATLSDR